MNVLRSLAFLLPRLAVVLLVVAGALSCSAREESLTTWQFEGAGEDVTAVLEHCAAISDGPLPRRCARALERVSACPRVEASCTGDGCDLLAALQCAQPGSSTAGQASGFELVGSLADGSRIDLQGAWQTASGSRDLRLDLVAQPLESAWARWLPDVGGAPASDVDAADLPSLEDAWFDGSDSFLHVRWRPRGGLALSAPAVEGSGGSTGGMADRLYGLGSRLFSRAVLEGTAELVLYPPREGGEFPGVGLAVAVRSAQVASSAVESYLEQMMGRWSFERVPYSHLGLEGACILELRVLPELAPCFLLSDRALFVGWNRQVLEQALGASAESGDGTAASDGWLRADFAQWAIADRRIAASRDVAVGVSLPFESAFVGPTEVDGADLSAGLLLSGSTLTPGGQPTAAEQPDD